MTDMIWIRVWQGLTSVDRVAYVLSLSRWMMIGVINKCVKVDSISYVFFYWIGVDKGITPFVWLG